MRKSAKQARQVNALVKQVRQAGHVRHQLSRLPYNSFGIPLPEEFGHLTVFAVERNQTKYRWDEEEAA